MSRPTASIRSAGEKSATSCRRSNTQGKTVFINSHLLSELEMVCDRVAILVGGRSPTGNDRRAGAGEAAIRIRDHSAQRRIMARRWMARSAPCGRSPEPRRYLVGADPAQNAIAHGAAADNTWIELEGDKLRIGTTDAAAVQPLLDAVRRASLVVRRVQPIRPSLEELFMSAVQQTQTEQNAASPGNRVSPGCALMPDHDHRIESTTTRPPRPRSIPTTRHRPRGAAGSRNRRRCWSTPIAS